MLGSNVVPLGIANGTVAVELLTKLLAPFTGSTDVPQQYPTCIVYPSGFVIAVAPQ